MKPIEPSANINRRALVSTLALLPTLSAPFLSISASAQTATSSAALPSWNEGTAKQAILDFVRDTTTPANPKFVSRRNGLPRSTRTARYGSSIRCTAN
jgi:hypothetical protein